MTEERRIRIVIADDEPDLCEMLAVEFRNRGYESFAVLDGAEALRLLESEPVDVIVTDLRMPNLDGLHLLDRVKNPVPDRPLVILMSAYADIGPQEAYHRGAEACFDKPFRLADLANSVTQLLRPPTERWCEKPHLLPLQHLHRRGASIQAGCRGRTIALGRGGLFLAVTETVPAPGLCVTFTVEFEEGPINRLCGIGTVRWADRAAAQAGTHYCGIEFLYLDDATRPPFLEWLAETSPRAYIPDLSRPA